MKDGNCHRYVPKLCLFYTGGEVGGTESSHATASKAPALRLLICVREETSFRAKWRAVTACLPADMYVLEIQDGLERALCGCV